MTDQIQFTIKPELLPVLGKISGHPFSPVSPFRYGNDIDTAGGIARLAALGICDTQGTIATDKKDAVSSLALAEGFTRIYLTTPQRVTEYIAYFGPDETITGVSNDHGIQLITFPAPNNAMLEQVRQTIGFSRYRSVPFNAHLDRAETLVLSAMFDLQRKEIIRKFAEGKKADRIAVSGQDVRKMLTSPQGHFPWLSSDFVSLFPGEKIPRQGDLPRIFASLAEKKHIAPAEKGYRLSDEGIILARSHLLPSMYLTLTTGKGQPSGKTNIAGFSCIISGIHDLLYIDFNGGEVEIESVSSAGIHELVKTFLTDRSVLAAMDTTNPAGPSTGNGRRFCSQCGAPVNPGVRFCGTCGTPAS